MGRQLLVGTRKGLFTVERTGTRWGISEVAFEGDNVPMALADPRDGSLYAALEHGHFGSKLHRSADGGGSWEEVGIPTYPEPGRLLVPTVPPGNEEVRLSASARTLIFYVE